MYLNNVEFHMRYVRWAIWAANFFYNLKNEKNTQIAAV